MWKTKIGLPCLEKFLILGILNSANIIVSIHFINFKFENDNFENIFLNKYKINQYEYILFAINSLFRQYIGNSFIFPNLEDP